MEIHEKPRLGTWALEIAIWLNLMSYNSAIIFWYMLLQKEEINKI